LLGQQSLRKSAFPSRADESFHVLKVGFQRALPLRGQTVGCPRNAPFKRLLANHVLVFFQLSRVDAQVAVRCPEQFLEFVEGHRLAAGKGAHNSEPDRFVDDSIQFRSPGLCGTASVRLVPNGMTFRFLSSSTHRTS